MFESLRRRRVQCGAVSLLLLLKERKKANSTQRVKVNGRSEWTDGADRRRLCHNDVTSVVNVVAKIRCSLLLGETAVITDSTDFF